MVGVDFDSIVDTILKVTKNYWDWMIYLGVLVIAFAIYIIWIA